MDYILSFLAVTSSNEFTGFLILTGERILDDITKQVYIENRIDLY